MPHLIHPDSRACRNRENIQINPPAPPAPPPPSPAQVAAQSSQETTCPDEGRCIRDRCNIVPELLANNGYPPCVGSDTAPSGIVCPYPCTFGEAPQACVLTDWGPWSDKSGDKNACFCNDPNAKVLKFTNGERSTNCLIWAQQRTRGVATPARNGGACDLSEENTRETRQCPDRLLPDLAQLETQGAMAKSCPPRAATAQTNCGPPPLLRNGKISRIGSCDFPGGFVTYQCNPTYTLLGASFVWCEGTGEWSQPLPLCQSSGVIESSATIGNSTAETNASQAASLQSLLGFLQNVYYSRYGTAIPNAQLPLASSRSGAPAPAGVESASALEALEEAMRDNLPQGSYDALKDALAKGDWDTLEAQLSAANITATGL